MTMASELTRHGMACRIIDRLQQPAQTSKALGIQARTLELFEKMGIVDDVIAAGVEIQTMHIHGARQRIARLDWQCVPSRYPFLLSLPQWVTEEILNTHIKQQGIEVERGVSLASLQQSGSGVDVVLEHADGQPEQLRTRWLIGCDGPHSTVRHHLGLSFEGLAFDQSFALADVRMSHSLPPRQAAFFWRGGGFTGCIPLPDNQYRIILAYPPHGEPDGDVKVDELEQALVRCGWINPKVDEVVWSSRFAVNQRKVHHYLQGSVFLAGDACHIHSPIGGQGMNTGIQDAFNLGWKLALVDRQEARPDLLDSYESEREHFGRQLLHATTVFTRLALLRDPRAVGVRDHMLALATGIQPARTRAAAIVGQVGVSYHHSPIVSEYRSEPVIQRLRQRLQRRSVHHSGERAPDMDVVLGNTQTRLHAVCGGTRHVLFCFADCDNPERSLRAWHETEALLEREYSKLVDAFLILPRFPDPADTERTRTIYDESRDIYATYGLTGDGLVLVRPDGYIGFRCHPASIDRFRTYLSSVFGPGPSPDGSGSSATWRARLESQLAEAAGTARPAVRRRP
jgi:2-polyprenyl-6-methoxyphenol hydroxylase-like FAD-dependent oxidoreductase